MFKKIYFLDIDYQSGPIDLIRIDILRLSQSFFDYRHHYQLLSKVGSNKSSIQSWHSTVLLNSDVLKWRR